MGMDNVSKRQQPDQIEENEGQWVFNKARKSCTQRCTSAGS